MVYRRIIEWPNNQLNKPSKDFKEEDKQVVTDLLDTFRVVGGYGLSAPQIGFSIRAIVINENLLFDDSSLSSETLMINPVIVERIGKESFKEACFSIPSFDFDVERSSEVRVEWTNEKNEKEDKWFKGYSAACVQHEIDHLDGILTVDKISSLKKSLLLKKVKKKILLSIKSKKPSKEKMSKQKSLQTMKRNRIRRKEKKKK